MEEQLQGVVCATLKQPSSTIFKMAAYAPLGSSRLCSLASFPEHVSRIDEAYNEGSGYFCTVNLPCQCIRYLLNTLEHFSKGEFVSRCLFTKSVTAGAAEVAAEPNAELPSQTPATAATHCSLRSGCWLRCDVMAPGHFKL